MNDCHLNTIANLNKKKNIDLWGFSQQGFLKILLVMIFLIHGEPMFSLPANKRVR
jgi:hypothetical protein